MYGYFRPTLILSGDADVTVAGLTINSTVRLSQAGAFVDGGMTIGTLVSIRVGNVQPDGQYSLTGGANPRLG